MHNYIFMFLFENIFNDNIIDISLQVNCLLLITFGTLQQDIALRPKTEHPEKTFAIVRWYMWLFILFLHAAKPHQAHVLIPNPLLHRNNRVPFIHGRARIYVLVDTLKLVKPIRH